MRREGPISVSEDTIFQRGHLWNTGQFQVRFSSAGNLELRDTISKQLLWQSATSGGTKLAMQRDGNLVIYSATGEVLWATNTEGNPGATFMLRRDGALVIQSSAGSVLWTSRSP